MNENPRAIDDIVSPSDKPLLDLLFDGVLGIKKVTDIFQDRNSDKITLCLKFAVTAVLIESLFGINVNSDDVISFVSSLRNSDDSEE